MGHALKMNKMATGGCSLTTIEDIQQLNFKPYANVWEKKMQGVEFLGYEKVKAAIERQPAMIYINYIECSQPCQNGTAKNPQRGLLWGCLDPDHQYSID
jgi:hypothetical protein